MLEINDTLSDRLAALFQERRSQFIAFAYSYTRDHDMAEDLFMDAMMAVWQSRASLRPDSNLPALMLTVLKNKCLNYLERQRKRQGIDEKLVSQYDRELNLRIATLHATNPEQIFSEEIQAIVRQTLRQLPEQSRRIFAMSRYRHMSNKEIAQEMELSVKSVEFHITKCLRVLRVALRDYVCIWLL